MSKRSLILIFGAIALIFAAYLSIKNDKSKADELEPDELEADELEQEPEEIKPEPVKRTSKSKIVDLPINKTLTDEPIQKETVITGTEQASE